MLNFHHSKQTHVMTLTLFSIFTLMFSKIWNVHYLIWFVPILSGSHGRKKIPVLNILVVFNWFYGFMTAGPSSSVQAPRLKKTCSCSFAKKTLKYLEMWTFCHLKDVINQEENQDEVTDVLSPREIVILLCHRDIKAAITSVTYILIFQLNPINELMCKSVMVR